MKRDIDLIHQLLRQIEGIPGKPSFKAFMPENNEAEAQRVLDHLKLMEESALITSTLVNLGGFRLPHNIELTAAGHDFLVSGSSALNAANSGAARKGFSVGTWPAEDSRFSRRTVIAAIEVLESSIRETARLTRLFLKWGSELAARCDEGTLPHRFNHLIKALDENPGRQTEEGESLRETIVEYVVSLLPNSSFGELLGYSDVQEIFVRSLGLDGFAIREGKLIQTLPSELELPQAEDEVSQLLKKHGLTTSKGHLDQALASHGRGEWAAANSQIRAFYESLFEEIASRIDPSSAALSSSENRRARLATIGFLKEGLNEWGNDGKNYVNGLFKRLHPAGSHPGLSDQDDSTFRRHTVLIAAKLFLVRLDNWSSIP